jgi:Fe-S cluster assembly iron-binding protein IscA
LEYIGNMATVFDFSQEEGMVSLTDSAVQKFKETLEKQGSAGDGVRIFAVPGG